MEKDFTATNTDGNCNDKQIAQVDDIYPGFCCEAFPWEVILIFPDPNPNYNSIWGVCHNPECGVADEHYQGVKSICQEDFEEQREEADAIHIR